MKIETKIKRFDNHRVEDNGCWTYLNKPGKDGYGKMKINRKTVRAHRAYYEHYIGKIPEDLWVLHHCDNPICVNPAHLYAGTQLDNERDKTARGRRPPPPTVVYPDRVVKGEKHSRYGKGMPPHVMAALLLANKGRKLKNEHKEKYSVLTPEKICAIRNDPRIQRVIAKEYGISQITVSRIQRGLRWSYLFPDDNKLSTQQDKI